MIGFAAACLAAVAAAAVWCAAAPVAASMLAVGLLAGPHNWIEARVLLTQMPPRWGRLRPFFLTAAAGVAILTAAEIATLLAMRLDALSPSAVRHAVVGWNLALVAWATTLAMLRARQRPRHAWLDYAPAIGLAAAAAAIAQPAWFALAIVYLHPLMALAFLDRTLPPRLRRTYRRLLPLVPIAGGLVVVALWGRGNAAAATLSRQAGADLWNGAPAASLIGLHAFLELLHYAAWIAAIPWAHRVHLLRLSDVPLRRRFPLLVSVALLAGGGMCVLLWVGFAVDYHTTRDVYFAAAVAHVLAEIPFWLRGFAPQRDRT